MRRDFGCLSIPAFVSALLTLLAIAGVAFSRGGSLLSAGDLNAVSSGEALGGVVSHSAIGGQCEACHVAPWSADSMADRCMVCHTQIRVELASNDSLHGIFLQSRAASGFQTIAAIFNLPGVSSSGAALKCNACHPEHRGPQGALVEMDLADFPHDHLNFSLRAHRQKADSNPFVCADCHAGKYAAPFDVSTCINCHYEMQADFTQAHALEFGLECLNCHDGLETFGSNFDHNLFPFKLAGKHAQAACANCHEKEHSLAELQSAPQDCQSCHQADEPHEGRFGADCASCHTPEGWKPAKFDHNLARFHLEGRHVEVTCEACHAGDVFAGTPQDCFACHQQDDKHNGQLGADCSTCHSAAGWDQVNVNHSLFAYPLTGKHISVACENCHVNGVFKGTSKDCYACHQKTDAHQGRFGTSCVTCHTTSGWKPANFDHNLAAFQLTGAHVSVACEACHLNAVFKGTPQDCYSCHRQKDAHQGRFGITCAGCHTTSAWKPATFDHNLAAFQLTGAHVSVACEACHLNAVFKGTPQDCYSCHQQKDAHQGRFGTDCAACHSTSAWKPATFNHNLAAFQLTGAHVNAACEKCHVNGVYKGTPQDCYSCHRQNDQHNGQFGVNCGACHTTSTWKGATFNHNQTRFPLTGAHARLDCSRCHANGVYQGLPAQCVSCHADPVYHASMFGTNCAACHNTSNWSATYSGPHPGIADEGGYGVNHGGASCRTCHTSTLHSATCTACHDGSEGGEDDD